MIRTAPAPLMREALVSAAAAASLAAVLLWLGPPGSDFAAHTYQRWLFIDHGFVPWNNFWYAGRYSFVTYSVVYYPLAALLGIKVLALASVAAAALAFAIVVGREWGPAATLSTRSFAVLWAGVVLSAAFPFVLGAALALLSLWALQRGWRWQFALLVLLTLAASPLAFLLLTMLLAGIGIADRRSVRFAMPVVVIVSAAVAELVLWRLFPGPGRYPFHLLDLAPIVLFCVYGTLLTRGVERARQLQWILLVYLAGCCIAFVMPSALGANVERLRYAALPIAVLIVSLRRWRPLWAVVPAILLAISWNVTPLARGFINGQEGHAASSAYWMPAVAFLKAHLTPGYRVEAVDTSGHWPAVYLPEHAIPLVRGWYRQDDFPQNEILYGHFGARAYRAWLRRMAVRYVVLPDASRDYSSEAEAALLLSGSSGLNVVFRSAHQTIYEVPRPHSILAGAASASVRELGTTEGELWVAAPGNYRLAIRFSPYWRASNACLTARSDGMIELKALRAGALDLDFTVNVERGVQVLMGRVSARVCSR